ncbi:DUF4267 domain-containing protein [Aspergillus saccharolyticus JOP 1030-1]|uniref:Integral membrane protein n=1 Tax=Aspergillus saccharolyticus JOP 1030-1 TaxID=1450539 RepID=A0A318ZRL3_9EURO|nr:hypothetical protein BP01DRAFT_352817 [Aspergillus saccharolyticus JOP 1030-1]PYH49315.1 hypothetical protein BP01DRAFT_352817 [Aspergillus saccharolyticus JOP 1030-1]
MTASPNPIPAYLFGVLSLALGINAIIRPAAEYPRFGLPFETAQSDASHSDASVSPLMYLKGTRELSYGLLVIVLQYQGQHSAITTLAVVMASVALADGFVVWFCGGRERRQKACGHWGTFVGLGAWAWYRGSA